MPVERREQVIAVAIGSTGNGMSPICNGRRQPSRDGTSRMMREYQVRICERLGVKIPGPTRHLETWNRSRITSALGCQADADLPSLVSVLWPSTCAAKASL